MLRAVLLAWVMPLAAFAQDVSFHIYDGSDPAEVEEDTTVFVNGRLVAHFHLNAGHREDEVIARIPAAAAYDYALCGRITITAADGHAEIHQVDTGATLKQVDGLSFQALARANFTQFFLAPMDDDELNTPTAGGPKDLRITRACSAAIS